MGRGEERDKRGYQFVKKVMVKCYYCERVYNAKFAHRYTGSAKGKVHYKDVRYRLSVHTKTIILNAQHINTRSCCFRCARFLTWLLLGDAEGLP